MSPEAIIEVGTDALGRLYVVPARTKFPHIYREAMEISWDEAGAYLHAPAPPRYELASPVWWFQRMLDAAKAEDCSLALNPETKWHNVSPELQEKITASMPKRDP